MSLRLAVPLISILLAACATSSAVPTGDAVALKDQLVALEKGSWTAWQARDGAYFESFLSQDHVEVGFGGPAGKAAVVAFVGSPACSVASYALDDFRVTRISSDTALLVYHAQQKTTCGGVAVPSPVWVSSLYVYRAGQWQNALYQQSAASQ
jgi:hypothetical protein